MSKTKLDYLNDYLHNYKRDKTLNNLAMAEGLINNKTLIIQGILAEKCGLTPDLYDELADLLDDIRVLTDAKDSALGIPSNENSGLNIHVVVKSLPLTGERLEILEKTYNRLLSEEPTKL